MKTTLKSTEVKATTAKIVLNIEQDSYSQRELTALFILLGDYNALGRSIPVEVYNMIKENFDAAISEMVYLLK